MNRALLALSVVLTLLGIAAVATTLRLKRDVIRLQNEKLDAEARERLLGRRMDEERSGRRAAADALERARTGPASWPTFELRSGAPKPRARSAEFTIPANAALVILDLALPPALTADRYRVGLRSAPGDEFWMQGRLKEEPDRRAIRVSIPASALPAGDYELSVQAVPPPPKSSPIYYYFSVKVP